MTTEQPTNWFDQPITRDPNTPTKVYRIARTFAEDHWGRDLGNNDHVIKVTRTQVVVEMDDEGYSDMLSDAEHYACDGGGFDSEYRYLMQSAQRVAAALIKAGAPEVQA